MDDEHLGSLCKWLYAKRDWAGSLSDNVWVVEVLLNLSDDLSEYVWV